MGRVERPEEPAFTAAACAMAARATPVLERVRGARAILLRPKPGVSLESLAEELPRVYEEQRRAWALAAQALPARRRVLARALELAGASAAGAAPARLSPEREAEIAALLAEAAAAPRDPLGIAKPWRIRG